jgi:hypothetical protein
MVEAFFKVTSRSLRFEADFFSKDISRPLYQLAVIIAKKDRSYKHKETLR